MKSFAVIQPGTFAEAASLMVDKKYSLPVLKAGGVDVLDHLKEGLWSPDILVNVKRVRGENGEAIAQSGTQLRIEANTTLEELARSKVLLDVAPVLAQAAVSAATPQVRSVASAAGNLLQRPRCWYYRHSQFDCLKKGGNFCYAVEGENKFHAIFGPGPCHIVHPSNIAPALMVLDAVVYVTGGKRESVKIADLFHMPEKGILSEHNLEPGEVVTHFTCAVAGKSGFYAIKEKQSFDWPCAFACVALEVDGDTIKNARVCAGAVAPVPWNLPASADALKGAKTSDDAAISRAASLASQAAKPMRDNGYKLAMLETCVRRAVLRALGRDIPSFTGGPA